MNETDLRAELKRLASSSPATPARLDLDEILHHGRQRIRRRRAATLPASVAAAALVVLSSVGIFRVASAEFGGPAQTGAPSMQILEAVGSTNPEAGPWAVPADYPVLARDARPALQAPKPALQATLVQGHVAF
jgi:hypothetical protein